MSAKKNDFTKDGVLPLYASTEDVVLPYVKKSITVVDKKTTDFLEYVMERYAGYCIMVSAENSEEQLDEQNNPNYYIKFSEYALLCRVISVTAQPDDTFSVEYTAISVVKVGKMSHRANVPYPFIEFSANTPVIVDPERLVLIMEASMYVAGQINSEIKEQIEAVINDEVDRCIRECPEKLMNNLLEFFHIEPSYALRVVNLNLRGELLLLELVLRHSVELTSNEFADSLELQSLNLQSVITNALDKLKKCSGFLSSNIGDKMISNLFFGDSEEVRIGKLLDSMMGTDDYEEDSEEFDENNSDLDDDELFSKRVKRLNVSDSIRDRINKEIRKLSTMPTSSTEYYTQYNFVDFITSLPWGVYTEDKYDISAAREILEADHYGIKKVKERILEFIAVQQLRKEPSGTLICFVGPPGVGKTSVAVSIARAIGKNFQRLSLGGVNDEAEIRGHRRTYVAAMAGSIMHAIKNAGSSNPLILLDEIDKLSRDHRGDPASALLEVLDPAQNNTFTDHFVDMPYDLSKVMFVTTANTLSTIPSPLLDRLEIIEMSGYTLPEKKEIFTRYLIPKQLKANGLSCKLIFSDEALETLIDNYTHESGVREAERVLGKICRKIAMKSVEQKKTLRKVTITNKDLTYYLGVETYSKTETNLQSEVGIVNGLAWTQYGGEMLNIEVALFKGKGEMILTGSLGDVMKESARNALTLIRSHADDYQLETSIFENYDVHLNVPAGAVPKDGPSAGVTIATAMLSAYTKRPVNCHVAMTGEVTVKGRVLPIGGLKEKLLAAKRAGITDVIVPLENKKDVLELEKEITESLNIVYAKVILDVFNHALI